MKDSFGEDVACDLRTMRVSSFQKRFLWAHKEVDLALHPADGLVLQVGDALKFLQALGPESPDPFCQSQQAGSMSRSHRGGWK